MLRRMVYSCHTQKCRTVYMGIRYLHCFQIHPYYTPFFTKIQALLTKSVIFVDNDNIYVNYVMSTTLYFKQLFLPFSAITTTSCAFGNFTALNIDSEYFPSFFDRQVNFTYPHAVFVHSYYFMSVFFYVFFPLYFRISKTRQEGFRTAQGLRSPPCHCIVHQKTMP